MPNTLREDNQACIDYSDNPGDHKRTKHIDCRYHLVRERVLSGDIVLERVFTTEQMADVYTKTLGKSQFLALCSKLLK